MTTGEGGRHWRRLGVAVAAAMLSISGAEAPPAPSTGNDYAAFSAWLAADPGRSADYAAFHRFLDEQAVDDVVPAWMLLRTDDGNREDCRIARFAMPPRSLWPNVVPALRIARTHAVPAVGPLAVASAWRSPEVNRCAGGASQSRHLRFSAVDFIPARQPANVESVLRAVCARWRRAGASSGWGLVAYIDRAHPQWNPDARFHIDGTGYRTWGYSFRRDSSGCNLL